MLDLWKKQFNKDKFLMKYNEPQVFFQSQWQTSDGPSLFYLLYRCAISTYLIGTWLLSVIDPKNLDESQEFRIKWVIYLTNWGYTMCLLQTLFCTASLTAWIVCANKTKDTESQRNPWIKTTYKVYWICHIIATDIAFAITALYWSLIYDGTHGDLDALNIFTHGTNSVTMFIELCIIAHPIFLIHVYWPMLFGLVYIIFSGIYYVAGGTSRVEESYIYPVLDWGEPGKTLGLCIGVLVFLLILHSFSCFIYWLRTYVHNKLYKTEGSKNNDKYCPRDFTNSSNELV